MVAQYADQYAARDAAFAAFMAMHKGRYGAAPTDHIREGFNAGWWARKQADYKAQMESRLRPQNHLREKQYQEWMQLDPKDREPFLEWAHKQEEQ